MYAKQPKFTNMEKNNDYRISFFKPTTERAKYNRNMVILLISIWAVGVFGFHFLLRAIEKPTPEPELTVFNEVWDNVKNEKANNKELLKFAQSTLHVAGKVFIKSEHRTALDNGITWATFQLADSAQKQALIVALNDFELETSRADAVTDETYIAAKIKLGALAGSILQLSADNVLGKILPLELSSKGIESISDDNKTIIEAAMPLYMVHNRSVLTDTKFLGFPFHYFYTAVFLLILFIALCYAYCIKVDKYNKKMEIAE